MTSAVHERTTTLVFKAEIEIRCNPNAHGELLLGTISIPEKAFRSFKGGSELTLAPPGYMEAGQRNVVGRKGLQRCIHCFIDKKEVEYYIPSAYLISFFEK